MVKSQRLMKKILLAILTAFSVNSYAEDIPNYLYKVLSIDHWKGSGDIVQLPEEDHDFIHLSKEDQLERIISKYWANSDFVILKIDAKKLPGKMVYESNQGGVNKYFHLYDGFIPMDSIIEVKKPN